MEAKFLTDRGQVRTINEDAGGVFKNIDQQILAVIADGMGGHRSGEIASQLAVAMLHRKWVKEKAHTSPEQSEQWLVNTIAEINNKIYSRSQEDKGLEDMGTTVVTAIVTRDYVTVAHIGDSRCYIYNDNGFSQLTEDHSLVNELMRSGEISAQDAKNHPRKNIVLKALGTAGNDQPDVKTMGWEPSNKLLLCSDGLTDKVTDHELIMFLDKTKNIETIGQQMINLANERGGEDNISLIIINFVGGAKDGDKAC